MKHETWNPLKDLARPLHWRKPRRVRVVLDFADRVGAAAAFSVMTVCPNHTFEVLTSGIGDAAAFYRWAVDWYDGLNTTRKRFHDDAYQVVESRWLQQRASDIWPLPNVVLGVEVQDQPTADERIPLLLQCPAAARLVRVTPMRGAVNLRRWLSGWCPDHGLTPGIVADGYCQICGREQVGLGWVTCSGGSEPIHPDWPRSLRDQCVAAGVAFAFEGWGEWIPYCEVSPELGSTLYKDVGTYPEDYPEDLRKREPRYPVCVMGPEGERVRGWPQTATANVWGPGAMETHKVGKSRAGRLLDGRVWDEKPEGGE